MSKKSAKAKAAEPQASSSDIRTAVSPKETKADAIIALLRRPEGASLEQMMEATGWQKHSVRGFMAGALQKRHGLTALSEKTEHGRLYRIQAGADA